MPHELGGSRTPLEKPLNLCYSACFAGVETLALEAGDDQVMEGVGVCRRVEVGVWDVEG